MYRGLSSVVRALCMAIIAASVVFSPGIFTFAASAAKGLWVVFLAGCLAVLCGSQFLFGKYMIDRRAVMVLIGIAVLVAWIAIAALGAGGITGMEMVGLGYETGTVGSYGALIVFFLTAYMLARSDHAAAVYTTIAASASVLAAIHLTGLLFGFDALLRFLGDWFSSSLTFGIAAIIGAGLWVRRSDAAPWLGIGALLNLVATILAGSAVLVASVCVAIVATVLFARRATWRLVAAIGVAVAAALFVLVPGALPSIERIDALRDVRPTFSVELRVLALAGESPWQYFAGAGPNSIAGVWNTHRPTSVNDTPLWNADFTVGYNFVLDQMIMYGIPLVLSLFLVFALVCARALVSSRHAEESRAGMLRIGSIAAFFGIAWLCMYAPHVSFVAVLALVVGALVGLADGREAEPLSAHARHSIGIVLGTVLLVSGATLVAQAATRFTALAPYASAVRVLSEDPSARERAMNLLKKSVSRDDFAPALILLSQLQRSEIASLRASVAEMSNHSRGQATDAAIEAIWNAGRATEIDPKSIAYWLELGDGHVDRAIFSGNASYLEEARRAYEEARARAPTHPLPYLHLARLAITEGNTARARDLLRRAIELKPDYEDAWALYRRLQDSPQ